MKEQLKALQLKIIDSLSKQINDFYFVGGTALSLFYFDHRESEDLDFFTKNFSPERVNQIIVHLKEKLSVNIDLVGENLNDKDLMKVMVYMINIEGTLIKIDFVEDTLPLISPFLYKNDINILSLEDIYLKKIYAVTGFTKGIDEIGRTIFKGGRQKAKDLFDLYFLSNNYINLSKFVNKFCDQARKEGLIRWFRSFDRLEMKIELSEIKTKKTIKFMDIDKHFDKEIKIILHEEIS